MRLKSFRVKNFKSIVDTGECHLSQEDNILVLAGQNEAGKSAVIEALDFFGNGASEDFERLHRRRNESPEVACKFLLDAQDIQNIFIETKDNKLKKYLEKNPIIEFRRGNADEDDFEEAYFTNATVESLQSFFPETDEDRAEPAPIPSPEPPEEDAPSITTLDELEAFVWNESRNFTSYNSFTDLLPGEVTIADLKNHPAVQDFEKVFGVDFAKVAQWETRAISREEMRLNKNASDNLNTYWKQRLEEGGKYNFQVKILPQPEKTTSRIEFKIERNDGDPLFMEQKSKGFQWFSAFNLRLRALGAEDVRVKNLVILIDEPGQRLHEKAQRDVKHVLEELAQKKGAQVIYTTHHPNLIGTEGSEFARIRVVSNSIEFGTKVETPAQFASRSEENAKDTLSPVITAMGIHSVHSVLDTRRLNTVVEGISDHYYFSAFKKLLSKDERLYFLPACGVTNVPNLVSILIGWGCNYKAVFDDDPKSGRATYTKLKNEFYEKSDELAHEHILKLRDCNGIEDLFGKKDFFKYVLNKPYPKTKVTQNNSALIGGKKELLARLFLEKVDAGEVVLSKESEKKINEVFSWLYQKFKI